VLYQRAAVSGGQLTLDFTAPAPERRDTARSGTEKQEAAAAVTIPYPNTSEYYLRNFAAIAGAFKEDPIEAARYLLRAMPADERGAALAAMRGAGCVDRESYHAYLRAALPSSETTETKLPEQEQSVKAVKAAGPAEPAGEFRPYGAWTDFTSLPPGTGTAQQRGRRHS
jgi:hypothetical protein